MVSGSSEPATATASTDTTPARKLIVSVPSQHSRKPSIMDLLSEEYFPTSPSTDAEDMIPPKDTAARPLSRLELFARNLEEGVLSWGNEPFKYQYCGRGSCSSLFQDGYLIPLTADTAVTPGDSQASLPSSSTLE